MVKNIGLPLVIVVGILLIFLAFGFLLIDMAGENSDSAEVSQVVNDTKEGISNIKEGYEVASDIDDALSKVPTEKDVKGLTTKW